MLHFCAGKKQFVTNPNFAQCQKKPMINLLLRIALFCGAKIEGRVPKIDFVFAIK